jgi:hypothetical protein
MKNWGHGGDRWEKLRESIVLKCEMWIWFYKAAIIGYKYTNGV